MFLVSQISKSVLACALPKLVFWGWGGRGEGEKLGRGRQDWFSSFDWGSLLSKRTPPPLKDRAGKVHHEAKGMSVQS